MLNSSGDNDVCLQEEEKAAAAATTISETMDTVPPVINTAAAAGTSMAFSIEEARAVLAAFDSAQTDLNLGTDALALSLRQFELQLCSLEALQRTQSMLADAFGLDCALPEGCTDTSRAALSVLGAVVGHSHDVHCVATALPAILFKSENMLDRDHVRALALQAQCPQEAVSKELRAFQKAASERLIVAAKRAIVQAPGRAKSAASVPQGRSPAVNRTSFAPAADTQGLWRGPEAILSDEEARREQLTKLGTLLGSETGAIRSGDPSVVGQFTQQMAGCPDWAVRREMLGAMSRTSLEVLWRLLQNSRVLGALHSWLQDAVSEGQTTMVRTLLDTMTALPMRRDLLKNSNLEKALEALAGGGSNASAPQSQHQQRLGISLLGAEDPSTLAALRRKFSHMAESVLLQWRRDPDEATIMRRAGGVLPETYIAPAPQSGPNFLRKRAAPPPSRLQTPGAARGAPRPRLPEPAGVPPAAGTVAAGGTGSGSSAGPKRPSLAAAAGSGTAAVDMTAKLGERGPVDTDVVAGFRSRFGDGSVRRSQLARPAKAAVPGPSRPQGTPAPDVPSAPSPSPAPAAAPAAAPVPAPAQTPARTQAAGTERDSAPMALPATAGTGPANGPARQSGPGVVRVEDAEAELDREAVARLRAERDAQRQASALATLQAEARKLPEVAAAERAFLERHRAYQQARVRRLAEEEPLKRDQRQVRETVPWVSPPPALLLPSDQKGIDAGHESREREVRARERQQVPKVSYTRPDRVPDSPTEPPPQPTPPPPQPLSWYPSLDWEYGVLDWWRQNLAAWDNGQRLPDYALPPAVLHKHLNLDPKYLRPNLLVVHGLTPDAAPAPSTLPRDPGMPHSAQNPQHSHQRQPPRQEPTQLHPRQYQQHQHPSPPAGLQPPTAPRGSFSRAPSPPYQPQPGQVQPLAPLPPPPPLPPPQPPQQQQPEPLQQHGPQLLPVQNFPQLMIVHHPAGGPSAPNSQSLGSVALPPPPPPQPLIIQTPAGGVATVGPGSAPPMLVALQVLPTAPVVLKPPPPVPMTAPLQPAPKPLPLTGLPPHQEYGYANGDPGTAGHHRADPGSQYQDVGRNGSYGPGDPHGNPPPGSGMYQQHPSQPPQPPHQQYMPPHAQQQYHEPPPPFHQGGPQGEGLRGPDGYYPSQGYHASEPQQYGHARTEQSYSQGQGQNGYWRSSHDAQQQRHYGGVDMDGSREQYGYDRGVGYANHQQRWDYGGRK